MTLQAARLKSLFEVFSSSFRLIALLFAVDCSPSLDVDSALTLDTQPPHIQCPASFVSPTDAKKNTASLPELTPVTITDNNKVVSSSFLVEQQVHCADGMCVYPMGVHQVMISATDASGNSASCELTITVRDLEPPVFGMCPADIRIRADADAPTALVSWPEMLVVDNSQQLVVVEGPQLNNTRFGMGTMSLTFTAVDSSRNFASCTFLVTVVGTFMN